MAARRLTWGRWLVVAAAVVTIVGPITADAVAGASAHMQNPRWLPHAKLHTAMSFHAAIALGGASLAVLALRWRRPERADLAVAAFLATSFWVGLLLAGLWPDTSYGFAGDPAFADVGAPAVLGVTVYPNALGAAAAVVVGWTGYGLASSALRRGATRPSGPAAVAPQAAPSA